MNQDNVNQFVIVLMFVVRCLVPLLIMLGISYLLRRLGLIRPSPQQPNGSKKSGEGNNNVGGRTNP